MTEARVEINQAALDNMLKGRGGDVGRIMAGFAGLATQSVRQVANERVNRRTGEYVSGISSTITNGDRGDLQVVTTASAPHSIFLERGTRRASRARTVNIPGVGYRTFVHPGIRAYRILEDGVNRAASRYF